MLVVQYNTSPGARRTVLEDCLKKFNRIAVSGGPRTGKSTLVAGVADRMVVATDDFRRVGWDAQPAAIITACQHLDRYVVEGVQVPRAIRAGLEVDCIIWLVTTKATPTDRQRAMSKGIVTTFESIRDTLTIPVFVTP